MSPSRFDILTEPAGTDWYAVYTRHQHEKAVARILKAKGIETFLPLYQVARRWQDRVKSLSVPLFPCYVFVRSELARTLDIMTTPGIHTFVMSGSRPASIPSVEIDTIRRGIENGRNVEPHPYLKAGERVRVKSGPLEGIEGILVRKKNLFRLVLSVEMLGKAAALEVDASLVDRLGASINNSRHVFADPRIAGNARACAESKN
jgi:transcription antitermination factor NusG